MTKHLIVNADDFGASPGINRGILQAHRCGVLTSTSLLVNTRWSEAAVELSHEWPALSVGLHVDLPNELKDSSAGPRLGEELEKQWTRFEELTGRAPTHLDSHHNVHRDPLALPYFLDLAEQHSVPLREHSPVRYFPKFYGQWGGETHLEQISVEGLTRMLATEIGEGVTELSCHPGCLDSDYATGYSVEREAELRTLCDPRLRQVLAANGIELISYHDLAGRPASASV
jgi:chitin disaccharide deacetylase